jgi:NADH-ubiquinone oxidoreductase chain 5
VFNHYIAKPALFFGHDVSYKIIDRGLIEYIGPQGIAITLKNLSKAASNLQSGYVYNYAFTIFLATTVILVIIPTDLQANLQLFLILPIFAYLTNSLTNTEAY